MILRLVGETFARECKVAELREVVGNIAELKRKVAMRSDENVSRGVGEDIIDLP